MSFIIGETLYTVAFAPLEALQSICNITPRNCGYFSKSISIEGHAVRLEPTLPFSVADAARARRAMTFNSLGSAALETGQKDKALTYFMDSLRTLSGQAEVELSIAALLLEFDRPYEALTHLETLVSRHPTYAEAFYNRGNALLAIGKPETALTSYERAIELRSHFPAAFNNRGTALYRLQRFEEALRSHLRALELQPDYPSALNNCGNLLRDMDRFAESLIYLDTALALQPQYVGALSNRGHTLLRLGECGEAGTCFERAVQLNPAFDSALGFLHHARAGACNWTDYTELVAALRAAARGNQRVSLPFPFLFATDQAAEQLHCAGASVRVDIPMTSDEQPWFRDHQHERVRIGYLSADLREHAVAFLMAGVFEHHDRVRFDITALSLRPQDGGVYGDRISRAVDRFVDLSAVSDSQAVEQIRSLEIDIIVDLVGHTQGSRGGILALRPAPLQVNYLGYPGTVGANYVDYLIADEYVIPQETRPHYSEQIVYLPECFQANDDRRKVAERTPTRAELGLPDDALVLCCFNNNFKLTPTFFDVWMRLLQSSPGSVLWLVAHHPLTQHNLRNEAARRAIDPQRLIFAVQVPYEQHLARIGCADLFLDTLPFNGGTTVSDALWAGVPVLTCSGEAFAARMGGSLVRAIGLPELVCSDLEGYERTAHSLLANRERLAALRAHLVERRLTSVLFDTARFTRHLECAYELMHQRRLQGQPPTSLRVPALPQNC